MKVTTTLISGFTLEVNVIVAWPKFNPNTLKPAFVLVTEIMLSSLTTKSISCFASSGRILTLNVSSHSISKSITPWTYL